MNRIIEKNRDGTTLQRINEYAYLLSLHHPQQKSNVPLTNIHTELLSGKENLLINKGFIRIKEYVVDGYECRCHESKTLINNPELDSRNYLLDYKLEF